MPEGHTVRRLANEHARLFGGTVLRAASPQGRFAAGAARIDGHVLRETDANGKHLFHRYVPPRSRTNPGVWLHVHLGLYGKFTGGRLPVPAPRGELRLALWNDRRWLELRGPTACELITDADKAAIHDRLGADPLRADADPTAAYLSLARRGTPIIQSIMDQSLLAGVGLVYACEVLYRARVAPQRPSRDVSTDEFRLMWTDLVTLMPIGVRDGRIDTLRPEDEPAGAAQIRPRKSYVYRRTGDPCLVCGTPIAHTVLGARNAYWCPVCQPS